MSGLKGAVANKRKNISSQPQEAETKRETQQVNLYLTSALHKKLKIQAVNEERSMSAIVEDAVTKYLQQKHSS